MTDYDLREDTEAVILGSHSCYRCQSPSKTSIKPQLCTEQCHTLILNRDNSRATRTDMARNGQQPVKSRGNFHRVSESPRHKRGKMVQVALLAYILDITSSTGRRLCYNGGNMLCDCNPENATLPMKDRNSNAILVTIQLGVRGIPLPSQVGPNAIVDNLRP